MLCMRLHVLLQLITAVKVLLANFTTVLTQLPMSPSMFREVGRFREFLSANIAL
jgi:hypothetical protein